EDGEDEVRVGVRDVLPLLPAGTQADAPPSTRAQCDVALDLLIALVQGVLPWVQGDQEPFAPIGLSEDQSRREPETDEPRPEQESKPDAGGEQHEINA